MDSYDLTRELARDVVRALGYTGGENLPAELLDSVHDWLAESADIDETLATSPEDLAAEWQREFPDDSEPTAKAAKETVLFIKTTTARKDKLRELARQTRRSMTQVVEIMIDNAQARDLGAVAGDQEKDA